MLFIDEGVTPNIGVELYRLSIGSNPQDERFNSHLNQILRPRLVDTM